MSKDHHKFQGLCQAVYWEARYQQARNHTIPDYMPRKKFYHLRQWTKRVTRDLCLEGVRHG